MGIENSINKGLNDIKDAASEAAHRAAAQGEHAKRDVAGNDMTVGEHLSSAANEAKHDVQAEIDKTKRTVRDST